MEEKLNLDKIEKLENNKRYIATMRPVFNRRALFSDTTGDYLIPEEPSAGEKVTVRFRTARNNVDRVVLICGGENQVMMKEESDKHFDFYAGELQLGSEKVNYHFEIQSGSCGHITIPGGWRRM